MNVKLEKKNEKKKSNLEGISIYQLTVGREMKDQWMKINFLLIICTSNMGILVLDEKE